MNGAALNRDQIHELYRRRASHYNVTARFYGLLGYRLDEYRRSTLIILCCSFLASGCASTPGAHPQDMGAAQHQAMAAADERGAAQLQAQYNPSSTEDTLPCAPSARGGSQDPFCWTGYRSSAPSILDQVQRLRKEAADHRAASQALRDAEARACAGLSGRDRDISPFAHREDIFRVEPLKEASGKTEGAVITFRALPGLTAQWLQRVVDCHIARNAALGHVVPEMPWCPLVPRGVTARVANTSDGFAVRVSADNPESAAEVSRRASLLVAR